MSTALSTLLSIVSYNVLHCYAPLAFNSRFTAYGNGRGLLDQPLMEMEGDCLGNHWVTTRQPLIEMEGDCLGNHWATAWTTTRQPLIEMEGDCLGNHWVTTYGNSYTSTLSIYGNGSSRDKS